MGVIATGVIITVLFLVFVKLGNKTGLIHFE